MAFAQSKVLHVTRLLWFSQPSSQWFSLQRFIVLFLHTGQRKTRVDEFENNTTWFFKFFWILIFFWARRFQFFYFNIFCVPQFWYFLACQTSTVFRSSFFALIIPWKIFWFIAYLWVVCPERELFERQPILLMNFVFRKWTDWRRIWRIKTSIPKLWP